MPYYDFKAGREEVLAWLEKAIPLAESPLDVATEAYLKGQADAAEYDISVVKALKKGREEGRKEAYAELSALPLWKLITWWFRH
jgi:hypothetical protein